MTRATCLTAFALLTLVGLSCAPTADKDDHSSGPGAVINNPKPIAPVHVELPANFKDRLDAARKHIRDRYLPTSLAFWTVFHGILGVGPENAILFDMKSGKKIKAIDHICEGGVWDNEPMRGLEFVERADGVEVVTRPGTGTYQGHQDQFVAEMAQWGMSKDKVFKVKGKSFKYDDFIRYARAFASVNDKQELSWAVLIIGQYYGTDHKWENNRKEKLSLEDVLRYEIDQPIDTAACGGTHRLFGITWVYHLHMAKGGKKTGVWLDAAAHLDKYKKMAREFQNKDGTFSTKYVSEPGNEADPQLRINTTGHVFEWLALAMTDDELRSPWMQSAAEALIKLILDHSQREVDGGSLYHAAHGLEIYRTRLYGPADANPPVIPLPPKK